MVGLGLVLGLSAGYGLTELNCGWLPPPLCCNRELYGLCWKLPDSLGTSPDDDKALNSVCTFMTSEPKGLGGPCKPRAQHGGWVQGFRSGWQFIGACLENTLRVPPPKKKVYRPINFRGSFKSPRRVANILSANAWSWSAQEIRCLHCE